jgi:hypothetical protein
LTDFESLCTVLTVISRLLSDFKRNTAIQTALWHLDFPSLGDNLTARDKAAQNLRAQNKTPAPQKREQAA